MANKMFYTKPVGPKTELCLVYGWVGDNQMTLFIRHKETLKVIEDFGVMSSDEAITRFNNALVYEERK